jgi:hypothetical protein
VTPPALRAPNRRLRGRRRRATRLGAWAARIALLLLALAVGIALGQAIRDNPESEQDRTYVRTLRPRGLPPAPETVTVTVTR